MKTIIIDGVEYDLIPKEKEVETIYSDWRLPTIEELLTLVDYSKYSPASFDTSTVNDWYWASTTSAYYSDEAWVVGFDNGISRAYGRGNGAYVRFVRDGNNGLEWSETVGEMNWHDAMELASTYEGKVTFRSEKWKRL
jgi:hypothetical protein